MAKFEISNPQNLVEYSIIQYKTSRQVKMQIKHNFGYFFSVHILGRLPRELQSFISRLIFFAMNQKISKYFIPIYCHFVYKSPDYINIFTPPNGSSYLNFQDFFTRKYKKYPLPISQYMWPCDGLLCECGLVGEIHETVVKGNKLSIDKIFNANKKISNRYFFTNIFLHNKDYHRIHAPISGFISRIEHLPGELIMLRPWFYPNNPSYPAFRNERVNIDIVAEDGNIWYLSIVGGFGLGKVYLNTVTSIY